MKLDTIKTALKLYMDSINDTDEAMTNVVAALNECDELYRRYECCDLWDDEVYIIEPGNMSDFLNACTYDEYGKLYKKLGSLTLEQYSNMVRNQLHMKGLTDRALKLGYEIIRDNWLENEHYGSNNPDGTFNWYNN